MKKIRIVFFDTKPYDREFFDQANETFGFELAYFKSHLTPENSLLIQGAKAICLFVNDVVDQKMVSLLQDQGVEIVALRCAGYNNIDLNAVKEKMKVVRVPAYSPHAVAEHTAGLMLSLNRKIHRAYTRIRDNNFSIDGFLGFDLYGKTAGVIGTGQIGKEMIRILKGFGMHILAYDPFPDKGFEKNMGIQYVELPQLYQQSDIITLHCPLTPETHHLICAKALSQMKPNVMIINTSRGKLIDTQDLIDALKKKEIGSAGLDVYEEESQYFFEDLSGTIVPDDILSRLQTFPNVLMTSHQAFFTQEALSNIAEITLQNISDFFNNTPLKNEVKK